MLFNSLSLLSLEIIVEIVTKLYGDEIQRLHLCGSRLLNYKLSSANGVREYVLRHHYAILMPSFEPLSSYQGLKTLIIFSGVVSELPTRIGFESLLLLPRTISKLHFSFSTSQSCWIREVQTINDKTLPTETALEYFNFNQILPNLEVLILTGDERSSALKLNNESVKWFPSSLKHLELPRNKNITDSGFSQLPRGLEVLSLPSLYQYSAETYEKIKHLPLRILSIRSIMEGSGTDTCIFHSTLEELNIFNRSWSIDDAQSLVRFPANLKRLYWHSYRSFTPDDAVLLPPGLTYLFIKDAGSGIFDHLPKTLTQLEIEDMLCLTDDFRLIDLPHLTSLAVPEIFLLLMPTQEPNNSDTPLILPTSVTHLECHKDVEIPQLYHLDSGRTPRERWYRVTMEDWDSFTRPTHSLESPSESDLTTPLRAVLNDEIQWQVDTRGQKSRLFSLTEIFRLSDPVPLLNMLSEKRSIFTRNEENFEDFLQKSVLPGVISTQNSSTLLWLLERGIVMGTREFGQVIQFGSREMAEIALKFPVCRFILTHESTVPSILYYFLKARDPDILVWALKYGLKDAMHLHRPSALQEAVCINTIACVEILVDLYDYSVTDEVMLGVHRFSGDAVSISMIAYLHSKGGNIAATESQTGLTLAHQAAKKRFSGLPLLQWLAEHGAPMTSLSDAGNEPIDVARKAGYTENYKFLKQWKDTHEKNQ